MSDFVVSARKYRPQTFSSVVGQQAITTTLKNAIKSDKLAHAYLFCGPRGVGKTTCARIFAKTINCENLTEDYEACNECRSCVAFNSGRSMNIYELDAASNNSVEDIRKLIDQVRIPPQTGQYKVYIIDEVHMLSTQAFNAFLKTLEEPPKHAIFILATTEKHKILPTILSRCQIFDFNRIKVNDIVEHLSYISEQEGIKADLDALNIIAQKADGALRDALSFFDQIASFSGKEITYDKVINSLNVLDYEYYFKLTEAFLNGQYAKTLIIFDEILSKGFDTQHFIVGLSTHFRNLLVSKDSSTLQLMDLGTGIKKRYEQQAKASSYEFLLKSLDVSSKFDVEHKTAQNKRLHVELMLLKLSQLTGQLAKKYFTSATSQSNNIQQQQLTKQQNNVVEDTEKQQNKDVKKSKNVQSSGYSKDNVQQQTSTPKQQRRLSRLPGLNNILQETHGTITSEKKETVEQKLVEEQRVENTVLSEEEVLKLWRDFAKTFETESPRLYTLFNEYPVQIDEAKIQITVANKDQETKIFQLKGKINEFFKTRAGFIPDIKVSISEKPVVSRKPYTEQEKYEYLRKINPQLDEFSKQFKLFTD